MPSSGDDIKQRLNEAYQRSKANDDGRRVDRKDLPRNVNRLPTQKCHDAAYHDSHEWTDYEITRFVFHCEGNQPSGT